MREKMVYKLERDKLQNELNTLKLGTSTPIQSKELYFRKTMKFRLNYFVDNIDKGLGPTQTKLRELRLKEEKKKVSLSAEQRRLTGSAEFTSESHPRVLLFIVFV